MRSYESLLDASGYAAHPQEFVELIRILDSEIRLITPTDPEGIDSESESAPETDGGQKYYQLTHDYLVPSLREWLTRKQRDTRRGRAEMRLAERSAAWNAKPENRHLPVWWEYLNIRVFTQRAKWTSPERRMMLRAKKVHGLRGAMILVVTIALMASMTYVIRGNTHARMLTFVDNLETCNPVLVPRVLQDLEGFSPSLVRVRTRTPLQDTGGQRFGQIASCDRPCEL